MMKSTVLPICLVTVVGLLITAASKSNGQINDAAPSKLQSDKFIGKEAGQVRDDNGLKLKLVWCPPGFFTMEDVHVINEPAAEEDDVLNDDEIDLPEQTPDGPRKVTVITPLKVFLSTGYWLGKFEVTQAEWQQVMKTSPWKGQNLVREGEDFPATCVTWDEALEFGRLLTERERLAGRLSADWKYTLPTEAQWERACRARTETTFHFGDDQSQLGDYAWFGDNSMKPREHYAHRVGQKKPNPWGLHDMHGNVWEWCREVYKAKLPGGRDPDVDTGGSNRVFRGGAWRSDAESCRSSSRFGHPTGAQEYCLGFRVALSSGWQAKPADR